MNTFGVFVTFGTLSIRQTARDIITKFLICDRNLCLGKDENESQLISPDIPIREFSGGIDWSVTRAGLPIKNLIK